MHERRVGIEGAELTKDRLRYQHVRARLVIEHMRVFGGEGGSLIERAGGLFRMALAQLNDAEPGEGFTVIGRKRNLRPQRGGRRFRLTGLILRDAQEKMSPMQLRIQLGGAGERLCRIVELSAPKLDQAQAKIGIGKRRSKFYGAMKNRLGAGQVASLDGVAAVADQLQHLGVPIDCLRGCRDPTCRSQNNGWKCGSERKLKSTHGLPTSFIPQQRNGGVHCASRPELLRRCTSLWLVRSCT